MPPARQADLFMPGSTARTTGGPAGGKGWFGLPKWAVIATAAVGLLIAFLIYRHYKGSSSSSSSGATDTTGGSLGGLSTTGATGSGGVGTPAGTGSNQDTGITGRHHHHTGGGTDNTVVPPVPKGPATPNLLGGMDYTGYTPSGLPMLPFQQAAIPGSTAYGSTGGTISTDSTGSVVGYLPGTYTEITTDPTTGDQQTNYMAGLGIHYPHLPGAASSSNQGSNFMVPTGDLTGQGTSGNLSSPGSSYNFDLAPSSSPAPAGVGNAADPISSRIGGQVRSSHNLLAA